MVHGFSISSRLGVALAALLTLTPLHALAGERTQSFDRDAGWDGYQNRTAPEQTREVRQDFGFSQTAHAGARPGEIGGFIHPCAEPAYYARPVPDLSLNQPLSASGRLFAEGRQFHALIGFFNTTSLKEWRTANTVALRVYGRGDVFYVYSEYATRRWRAGGAEFTTLDNSTGRRIMRGFNSAVPHDWSLNYDPEANQGLGVLTARLDDVEFVLPLESGHKQDGATFNRFGLVNILKSVDSGGELWLDDLTIQGHNETFDHDPLWEGFNNRTNFLTREVRPWFDFGFSDTQFAGGRGKGELGGVTFRGDGRYPERMAFYGDRIESLDLSDSLRAAGRVSLRRGVSDSDTLIGFFHSKHSLESGGTDDFGAPPDFLGVRIGGPSRDGFFFAPMYRIHGREEKAAGRGPTILPDGSSHDWSLMFEPSAADGSGEMTVKLDQEEARLTMPRSDRQLGAHFDRFGIITTHRDGNGQRIYFDDLAYTATR